MNLRWMSIGIVIGAALIGVVSYRVYAIQEAKANLEQTTTQNRVLSGGDTTVFNTSLEAFAKPIPNMPTAKLREFTFGNKVFNTNWVTAPASVKTLDGLGPLFNRVSCSACHFKDGRGRPPVEGETTMDSMLIRLSVPGKTPEGGPFPHPAYGGQLNDRGIVGVPAEGQAQVSYTEQAGKFPDGEEYSLRVPEYHFVNMNYGPLGEDAMFSPRVAPVMIGLGLLEAISDETLRSFADPDDKDQDGVSGRVNTVWDFVNKKQAIGRFGWKANQPHLLQQNVSAAQGDVGLTTSLVPDQNCTDVQKECKAAPSGGKPGEPEMNDMFVQRLTFYTQTLGVPARRDVDDPVVMQGEKLFDQIGCNACHKANIKTGEHPTVPELSNQVIHPYTDLLVHDMGDALADKRPDFKANGNEWRTPPLWGIGLVKTVNHHTFFLHDGRARNLEEAILWHGGEGEKSMQAYKALTKEQRQAVLRFLESL